MKKNSTDLAVELDGIAALAFFVSQPLMEETTTASTRLTGEAIHGIASYIERIAADVGERAD